MAAGFTDETAAAPVLSRARLPEPAPRPAERRNRAHFSRIPDKQLAIITDALNPKAWMDLDVQYWEGPVTVSGSQQGVGYLEMTGY